MQRLTFFQPPLYNHIGRNQLWIDACIFAHDCWCGCNHPIAHFIDSVLPSGHKDRDLTINEILSRDLKETCPSGGTVAKSGGDAAAFATEEENQISNAELEEIFTEDAINELLDAAAKDEQPR
nr:MAG: hypothetical protein [Gammatorquevirus sp.]